MTYCASTAIEAREAASDFDFTLDAAPRSVRARVPGGELRIALDHASSAPSRTPRTIARSRSRGASRSRTSRGGSWRLAEKRRPRRSVTRRTRWRESASRRRALARTRPTSRNTESRACRRTPPRCVGGWDGREKCSYLLATARKRSHSSFFAGNTTFARSTPVTIPPAMSSIVNPLACPLAKSPRRKSSRLRNPTLPGTSSIMPGS